MNDRDRDELRLLEQQLERMRGMLGAYSGLFFRQITVWGVVSIVILALSGLSAGAPIGFLLTFIVPFAFLEAGYTFYYTVFARRHAEFIEKSINARFGRAVLAAHRLEAAYFYPPDAPKLSFLSFARLSGYGSVMTIGYSVAALFLWGAGMEEGLAQVAAGSLDPALIWAAVAWTLGVTAFLLWHFLAKRDEKRLLVELKASYPDAVRSRSSARRSR
jgi:DNA-binding transcriptional LysR family regulator